MTTAGEHGGSRARVQRHVRRDDTKLPLQSNSRLVRSIRHRVIVNTNLCRAYVFAGQLDKQLPSASKRCNSIRISYWPTVGHTAVAKQHLSLANVGTDLALLRSDLRFSAMMQKMNPAR